MKATNFIFKMAAIVLGVAAVICCVLANLEKITEGLMTLRDHCTAKRKSRCVCDEIDDYEDWEI